MNYARYSVCLSAGPAGDISTSNHITAWDEWNNRTSAAAAENARIRSGAAAADAGVGAGGEPSKGHDEASKEARAVIERARVHVHSTGSIIWTGTVDAAAVIKVGLRRLH